MGVKNATMRKLWLGLGVLLLVFVTVREYGCDQAQGYYFSEPLPAKEFFELLKSGKLLQSTSVRS